ncbi:DJ-1/PfpI family protein [Acerihabitans sp. TG2]|uniref:DJ-1/PfpI family protein n=1 Tax=Acerihabitans sp. TG2 TaxID=3096008 RepID=UPI002B232E27|nr:DJ-1/PfpI family protein [Acerihabitans sp. TG2]MEA9392538.1 DJ-1/PfpI family protein [Acerihabitans sp. TG2]
MSKAAVLLAPGFEEAEAIMTVDLLRRLDIEVDTLACQDDMMVVSYHNIAMLADCTLSSVQTALYDAIILPGGPDGSVNLAANPMVLDFIRRHDAAQRLICPLCSAGARVLGAHNLLRGRHYVCSGDLYQQVTDGIYIDQPVVEDGNLISGKGLGVAFDFAAAIAYRLTGEQEKIDFQLRHIDYK